MRDRDVVGPPLIFALDGRRPRTRSEREARRVALEKWSETVSRMAEFSARFKSAVSLSDAEANLVRMLAAGSRMTPAQYALAIEALRRLAEIFDAIVQIAPACGKLRDEIRAVTR